MQELLDTLANAVVAVELASFDVERIGLGLGCWTRL
jgi:hypothetical protein